MNINKLKEIGLPLTFILYLMTIQVISQDTVALTGPGHYEILNDLTDSVIIPFTMHNGKPLMQLEINGIKGTMMIDNGVLWDQIWLFGSPLVAELNLKSIGEGLIESADKNDTIFAYTSELTLKFKDIIFFEQPSFISPPEAGFTKMFPGVDGQLCNTFFKHFIVEFDFIKNKIVLHDPEKYEYSGSGCILDMQLTENNTYSVPFKITMNDGKVYNNRADIDLGGIYPFKVALNTIHDIQVPSEAKERPIFGGTEYFAKIIDMTIGDYTFREPTVAFGDEKTARVHPKNIGMIGLPMFMKFNVIFDYFNNKMYIEPNDNFYKPLE